MNEVPSFPLQCWSHLQHFILFASASCSRHDFLLHGLFEHMQKNIMFDKVHLVTPCVHNVHPTIKTFNRYFILAVKTDWCINRNLCFCSLIFSSSIGKKKFIFRTSIWFQNKRIIFRHYLWHKINISINAELLLITRNNDQIKVNQ